MDINNINIILLTSKEELEEAIKKILALMRCLCEEEERFQSFLDNQDNKKALNCEELTKTRERLHGLKTELIECLKSLNGMIEGVEIERAVSKVDEIYKYLKESKSVFKLDGIPSWESVEDNKEPDKDIYEDDSIETVRESKFRKQVIQELTEVIEAINETATMYIDALYDSPIYYEAISLPVI